MSPRVQQDPAEGSREIVERELARQSVKDRVSKDQDAPRKARADGKTRPPKQRRKR